MSEYPLHVTCQEVVEVVTDYLDGVLPDEELSVVEQHLNFCEGCVTYLEQMRATVAIVSRVRTDDLSGAMRERLITAFRDWRDR